MERMEKVVIAATRRTVTGKQVNVLRTQGMLPAVMYGHHFESTPITLNLHESMMRLAGLSSSSLVYISLDGVEHAALIREKQRNYLRGGILKHIDFQVVSLTEKIRAQVRVETIGISPAVKDFNGVIVIRMGQLEVEALPQNLPERYVVDISKLQKIGDSIHVRDIVANADVEILADPDDILIVVTMAAGEEVEGEGGVTAEPEVIEKGKKEEEGSEK
jgi:large subunit ribosomal protein L25